MWAFTGTATIHQSPQQAPPPHTNLCVKGPLLVVAHFVALLYDGRLPSGVQTVESVQHQLLATGLVEHLGRGQVRSREVGSGHVRSGHLGRGQVRSPEVGSSYWQDKEHWLPVAW